MRFSANLGFLWTELSLPDAIRAAGAAGFDAVECHWPYAVPVADVQAALEETGLRMLSLNTRRGDVDAGEFGLTALPGREAEARAAIDEAIAYARAIGTPCIHVMAGRAEGADAGAVFAENLRHACDSAAPHGISILIEALNRHDAPGYFLSSLEQVIGVIEGLKRPNLRLMFDFYHVERTEGDAVARLRRALPHVGHIQFASVPDRGAPDHGELDYDEVFRAVAEMGHTAPLGAEYRPEAGTDASLDWLRRLRAGGRVRPGGRAAGSA
ncbi:isomerase [Brevirhabdus pacifica]|uniref:Isomerase n=1 Tax=Brevirhabdus pacifica TaxID=1267768 RepID=A0A1U7DKD1_9RHOB|nr:TIM barrel protein [Brevirhabdus pacifica]APX90385.1 isomerase [Brevirhabdus pacifica]OWU78590.1 isomerase [Loktanella sp. 22II-4b]PJJ85527.1 hydroxypyruvate isomerase [Brevirhabdus pacifica]